MTDQKERLKKHDIFGNLKEGEKPRELTAEELEKLHALMRGLSDEKPLKQITERAGV